MKKKYLILTGLLFAWMGAQPVAAQTDVTSTYIKNADFSVTSDWVTGNVCYNSSGGSSIGDTSNDVRSVTDWVNTGSSTGWCAGASIQYGSAGKMKDKSMPENPSGSTEGGCLALLGAWGQGPVYTQEVTLPAGFYTLSFLINNVGTNSNFSTSLFGFKTANNTYYTADTSYPVGTWTKSTVSFWLLEETTGNVSIGYKASGSSNSTPWLVVDNVQLIQWGITATEANPEEFTPVWIQNASFESGYNVGWTFTKTVSGWEGFSVVTDYPSDGEKCANIWAQNVTSLDLYQNTPALPSGKYKLTGDLRIDKEDQITDQALYATVGNKTTKSGTITTIGNPWNGADSWNNLSLEFVITEEGSSARVGISSTGSGSGSAGWFQADNIRLYYYGIDLTALHEAIDNAKEVYNNSVATTSAKEAFNAAILSAESSLTTIKVSTEVATVVAALESARQAYVVGAQPNEGYTFDYTFLVAGVGDNITGWERTYSSQNFQYQNSANKNTEEYVKTGYLESWNKTAFSGTMTYTKTGLPVGGYSLSAYAFGYAGSGQVSLIANDKSEALSTETDLYQNPSVEGVKVNGSGELTFGLNIESSTWVGITNIQLTYAGCDYEDYQVLVVQAQALLQNPMQATIKSALEANISLTETATRAEIAQAVVNLQATLPLAATSVASYAYLQREITTAESLGVSVTTETSGLNNGTYDSDGAVAAAQALNVAASDKVDQDYPEVYPVPATWTGSNFDTPSTEHWSGETHSYYDKWGANLNMTYSNTLTLPEGEYVLEAAGRAGTSASLTLTVGEKTVQFTSKGNTGYGIATNGTASYDPNETYANGGKGFGWEWQYVHIKVDTESEVTLTATLTTGSSADWGSFSDLSLKMTVATYRDICYKDMEKALEECKPWTDAGYEPYNTCSAKTKDDYATGQEINEAIAALREAFDTYAQANLDIEHSYDMTSWIVNPTYDNGTNGWSTTENYTGGRSAGVNNGVYAWTLTSGYMRHATIYQTIENLPAGTYRLSAKMAGNPNTDTGTYVYATTGNVNHWADPVFDGYVRYGYYTTGNQGAEAIATTTFTITETSNVRIGALSWSANVSGNTKGSFSVDDWKLERILYAIEGDAKHVVFCGEVPADVIAENVEAGACSIDLTYATGISNMQVAVDVNPNLLVYANEGQISNSNNVIVDGTCASLVVADKHPFAAPTAFTATAASYEMTAVANTDGTDAGFGTLCLPFEATTLAGEAYKLDQGATMGGELYATRVTTIPANTPVLVKTKGAYSGENVTVAATPSDAACEAGQLVGVYAATPAPVGSFVLQNHGGKIAFYLVNDVQPTVNPFRAYIKPQAAAASLDMLSVVFDFDDATGVEGVEAAEGVTEVERYDAAGVRISRPQKGVNIVRMSDGSVRKVVIK